MKLDEEDKRFFLILFMILPWAFVGGLMIVLLMWIAERVL